MGPLKTGCPSDVFIGGRVANGSGTGLLDGMMASACSRNSRNGSLGSFSATPHSGGEGLAGLG